MKLLLNLTDVIRQFRLFREAENILTEYSKSDTQSFSEIQVRYPKLWDLISDTKSEDVDVNIANLIYNQRGSYKSIDMLSKVLGFGIELYHNNEGSLELLNNPNDLLGGGDKTPVEVNLVKIQNLYYNGHFKALIYLEDVIKELVWLYAKDAKIEIERMTADFNISQKSTYNYGLTLINNIIISEVEEE